MKTSFGLLALSLSLTIFVVNGAPSNKTTCSAKARERIDLSVLKLACLGEKGRDFPTNGKELKAFCRETIELTNKIEAYIERCFGDNIRDLAKIIFYSIRSIERKFCRRKLSKKSRALLATTTCLNKYARNNTMCMDDYLEQVKMIINVPKEYDSLKIPYACCSYVTSMNCASNLVESEPCMSRNKDIILDFVRGLGQGLIDVTCGDYNDQTDRCDKMPPMPQAMQPSGVKSINYHSPLFALIDLFESIGKN